MASCLIGLGSNVGQRRETLDRAVALLSRHDAIRVTAVSSWLQTSPVGGPAGQSAFLNGAAVLETSLSPQSVLGVLLRVESQLGRRRDQRWGPRTIDLDLLLYDRRESQTARLSLPHPRMAWRRFVLQPAAEVAAEMVHPSTGWTIARLLKHLDTSAPYVALAGSIGVGKTSLAEQLARTLPVRLLAEEVDSRRLASFYANPTSQAWQVELKFLDQRRRRLAAEGPAWNDVSRWTVSDFWFGQSPAFARVWLPTDRRAAFQQRWRQLEQSVVRPRLIVLMELPADELLARVARRGRPYERGLDERQLGAIAEAIAAEASRPDQGPVMRLGAADPQVRVDEVVAAMQSME